MSLLKKSTPPWINFIVDVIICICSIILAYLLRFNFQIPSIEKTRLPYILFFVIAVRGTSFLIGNTYRGIYRYTTTRDGQKILYVISAGSLFFMLSNGLKYYFIDNHFIIPFSIVIIDFFTSTFSLVSLRLLIKIMYLEYETPERKQADVLIFGAGESGIVTKKVLDRDAGIKYRVIAFIDDNKTLTGKKVDDILICHSSELESVLKSNTIHHMIISVQSISAHRKKELIEICLAYNTKVFSVPPVNTWINGELSFKQIKKVRIEDLLEREEIKLDEEEIRKQVLGKRILVTGAAGSIGSEIIRQLIKYNPEKIILFDIAESPLFFLELEMHENLKTKNFEPIIGDIRNKQQLEYIFQKYRPEIVYHAAAYKHVPMMENNVSQAISVNVNGTKILADLSLKYDVKRFVMISTDKAVNPTNVMGASKRIAEIYTQSLVNYGKTKFITTRFGNVLGSNGSVIPLFKKQIENGGPLTITHPEITRFFMTIPEACQLVLEAGAIGKGGEIFIFDMGESVKIIDLAKKMIKLSGLTIGKDIQLVFTGLRPGEKLYEELLCDTENTIPTHHPKIMIARTKGYDLNFINTEIQSLLLMSANYDNIAIVKKMKEIVPEFKSKNSVFETLDQISA